MIAKYILIIALAAAALILTYRAKRIAPKIFKNKDENANDILKVKFVALAIGIIDFILALVLI
ncbi:MAG: hypothetical protein SOZ34_01745 [Clostridia bacterium]|nr:hypothetical protein [Clostridia bacterium]